MRDRGHVQRWPLVDAGAEHAAFDAVLTIHPSAALRAPTSERRHELRAMLVADLDDGSARGAR
jgi:hypothetical protein